MEIEEKQQKKYELQVDLEYLKEKNSKSVSIAILQRDLELLTNEIEQALSKPYEI